MLTRASLAACVLLALSPAETPRALPHQSQPTFRSQVVLVPVDVRVVDRNGEPVTDLGAADFTVLEDGARQTIAEFATRSSLGSAAVARTFVLVLGRGRLNDRGHALDAVIELVRSRLQPIDRLCVVACARATDLTTDHAAIVRLLERYRERHEDIEEKLAADEKRNIVDHRAGPDQPLSPATRSAIEALFDAPGLPAVQLLPGSARPIRHDGAFYLLRAIDLLGRVQGEKHLVLVAERTPGGPPDSIVRKAAAARVSVSLVRTGGLNGEPGLDDFVVEGSRLQRDLAEQTGGIAALYQAAAEPLERLVKATRFQYLLGYYPARPAHDGEYRQLRVEVRRRGVTVFYRHGYEALAAGRGERLPDFRSTLWTARILEMLAQPPPPRQVLNRWMPLTRLSGVVVAGPARERVVRVEMALDPSALTFVAHGDAYSTTLDAAVFCSDANGRRAGEKWEHIDLEHDANMFSTWRKQEQAYSIAVPVNRSVTDIKVVLYEYDSDLFRVVTVPLKRP